MELTVRETAEGLEFTISPQAQVRLLYVKNLEMLKLSWRQRPRPCFNREFMSNVQTYYDFLKENRGIITFDGNKYPIKYFVTASDMKGIFSLGGDLDLFRSLVKKGDRSLLLQYGLESVRLIYQHYNTLDLPLTTVALVQGDALGGGFETALSNEIIIAEKNARFGFPEILFNIFPGMGAVSFLQRKVGYRKAKELIQGGKIYTAEEMYQLGAVDVLAEVGQGKTALKEFIEKHGQHFNGMQAIENAFHISSKLDYAEMEQIVTLWVDRILNLRPQDLVLINNLVSRQNELYGVNDLI